MKLHEKIAQLAERKGLSQRDVARLASDCLKEQCRDPISSTSMNRYFNGAGVPDLYESAAIAHVLGVPLSFLADDAQAEPPPGQPAELQALLLVVRQIGGYSEAIRRLANYGVVRAEKEFVDPRERERERNGDRSRG